MKKIIQRIRIAATLAVLCAIGAGNAWGDAPVATAVWETGGFTTSQGGYSITIDTDDGNTINEDGNIVIGSTATKGVTIDVSSASKSAVSVLIKYSAAPSPGGSRTPVSFNLSNSTSSPDVGLVTRSSSYPFQLMGYYNAGTATAGTLSNNGTNVFPEMSASGGYLLFSYDGATLGAYVGTTLNELAGGSWSVSWPSRTFTSVAIGGQTGVLSTGNYGVWPDMVIEKVALFVGAAYENTADFKSFVWPSSFENKYGKFSYAKQVYTWTTSSSAIDNCIPNAPASYTVFDTASGSDTATVYTGGATTASKAYWHYFCYSSSAGEEYVAPGYVLRFTAGDYKKSLAGDFSPVTYGGMIVESGATGYGFADANDRYSVLGDPTGTTETWFEFNEDFIFGRSQGCHLTGTVNLNIADGKTFTIAGTTTKCATTAKSNALSGTNGGTLKMHGSGHLAATLVATDATLDYSDLDVNRETPFIQGNLTINDSTKFVFPSTLAEDTDFTLCSGTLTGGLTHIGQVTVDGNTFSATLTFNENKVQYKKVLNYGAAVNGAMTWENLTVKDMAIESMPTVSNPEWGSNTDMTLAFAQNASVSVNSAVTLNKLTISDENGAQPGTLNGSLTASTTQLDQSLTIDGSVNLGAVTTADGATLTLDATSGLTVNSDTWLRRLLETGMPAETVTVKGFGNNGLALTTSNRQTYQTHLAFDGGTHNLYSINNESHEVCNNSSNENPMWLVKSGTTLNFQGRDFGGWNGGSIADICVIAVEDGGTINLTDNGNK